MPDNRIYPKDYSDDVLDKEIEANEKHITLLNNQKFETARDLDKWILTLASSIFGLTVTFISSSSFWSGIILIFIWIAFAVSVISSVMSIRCSCDSYDEEKNQTEEINDAFKKREYPTDYSTNIYSKRVKIANKWSYNSL